MTQVHDTNGAQTLRTEYDPQGRAYRQWDGLDKKLVELTFNPDNTTTIKDALNNTETHTYDGRGTLVTQANGVGTMLGKRYDSSFRPSLITEPLGNETK